MKSLKECRQTTEQGNSSKELFASKEALQNGEVKKEVTLDDKGEKEVKKQMKVNYVQKTETVNEVEKTEHIEGEEPEDEKLKGGA